MPTVATVARLLEVRVTHPKCGARPAAVIVSRSPSTSVRPSSTTSPTGAPERRPQCGESGVAAACTVVPVGFEVVQERGDHLGIEIGPVERGGGLAGAVLHEGQQEPGRWCGRSRWWRGWPDAA